MPNRPRDGRGNGARRAASKGQLERAAAAPAPLVGESKGWQRGGEHAGSRFGRRTERGLYGAALSVALLSNGNGERRREKSSIRGTVGRQLGGSYTTTKPWKTILDDLKVIDWNDKTVGETKTHGRTRRCRVSPSPQADGGSQPR